MKPDQEWSLRSVLSVVLEIDRLCIRLIPPFTMSKNRVRNRGSKSLAQFRIPNLLFRRSQVPAFRYLFSVFRIPIGGADRDRTDDLKLAKLALSQLSYGPGQGSED